MGRGWCCSYDFSFRVFIWYLHSRHDKSLKFYSECIVHVESDRRFEIQPRVSVDSLYTLKIAAITEIAGVGVPIVSLELVADDMQQHQFVRVMADWYAAIAGIFGLSACALLLGAATTIYRYDT